MRFAVTIPISIVAGVATGILVVQRPRQSISSARPDPRINEERTAPAMVLESAASTEVKMRRLAEAMCNKNRSERENGTYLAIQALTAEDLSRFMVDRATLNKMMKEAAKTDASINWNYMLGLLSRWLEVDRDAAIAWIPRAIELDPEGEVSDRDWMFQVLSIKMPAELLAQVSSIKDAKERTAVIGYGVRELAEKDSAKAKAWLDACTDAKDRPKAEKAFRLGLAKADPLRAIELADSIESRFDAEELLRTAAGSAAEMGPGILRQLVNLPMKPWMMPSLLGELAKFDPEEAMDVAMKSLGEGRDVSVELKIAFDEMARRDPQKCIEKLAGLQGAERAAAISAFGSRWASREPVVALDWLLQQPITDRSSTEIRMVGSKDTVVLIFSDWMGSAPEKARAWADALPAGPIRDTLQNRIARNLADRGEPAEAAQLLMRLGQAAEPTAFTNIAEAWARKDPQAAADWALSQDPGPTQSRALAGIVGAWANRDQAGVENWLSQFPAGEARDRSVKAFLWRQNAWTTSNEQRTAEFDAWFDLIDDPWQRAIVARSSFFQRRSRDLAAARNWLSSIPNVDPEVIRTTLRDNAN